MSMDIVYIYYAQHCSGILCIIAYLAATTITLMTAKLIEILVQIHMHLHLKLNQDKFRLQLYWCTRFNSVFPLVCCVQCKAFSDVFSFFCFACGCCCLHGELTASLATTKRKVKSFFEFK